MGTEDKYFGYTTGSNRQLLDSRRLAHRMGEDISHYPPPEGDQKYVTTINWADPHFTPDQKKNETALFANDSIEKIYKRVMAQDSGVVRQLGEQWWRVIQVIDDITERVDKSARALAGGGGGKGGWTGAGADAFLARGPGATLKSLDDWREAAMANWLGTLTLADTIVTHQSKMSTLYDRYKKAMVGFSADFKKEWLDDGESLENANSDVKDQYVTEMRQLEAFWSLEAQKLQYEMAQAYWSVMSEELNGGTATVYEGPTDAIQPNPKFIASKSFPQIGTPNIGTPHLTPPAVKPPSMKGLPNAPHTKAPKLVAPDLTAPNLRSGPQPVNPAPHLKAPDITLPQVGPEQVGPPQVGPLPVVPRVPGGQPQVGTKSFGQPGTTKPPLPKSNPEGLLKNLGGERAPGVLRSNPSTPSLPQAPGKQPPAQIRGRVPGQGGPSQSAPPPSLRGRQPGQPAGGAPSAPRVPGESAPTAPGTARGNGPANQFGRPAGNPSSPVLRAPRTPQAPSLPTSPRTGVPGAAPPVLNRSRPHPVGTPPQSRPALPTPGQDNPLTPPPTTPTSKPVVGRSAPTPAERLPGTDSSGSVLRSRRGASSGYEAQIGSRRKESQAEQTPTVDQEFETIRKLLDDEAAWKVSTPGGGVLDASPGRPAVPSSEPKPTLGA